MATRVWCCRAPHGLLGLLLHVALLPLALPSRAELQMQIDVPPDGPVAPRPCVVQPPPQRGAARRLETPTVDEAAAERSALP